MRVHSLVRGFFLLSLLFVVSFCNADDHKFEVVGIGECADCKENSFKTSQAFTGLHVTIDCKLKTGEIKRVGAGELDEGGKFKVSLPQEIVQDGQKLKEECYAQLHSAAAIPCPAHNGLEASKILFKSQTNGKTTFGPTKTLRFSTALCTSKFLWPFFKYPPLPKTHPWLKNFGHPWPLPPFPPLHKPKLLPPPIPIYKPKPKPPVYKPKPLPPPVPIYKPKPPVPKPAKKPRPPISKPKPPVYKPPKKPLPPPVPVYKPKPKPPVVTKPMPPPIPPFYKKPCPPLLKLPPLPKIPPFPKIPPKYFPHPKFGYFPPLPPSIPHP